MKLSFSFSLLCLFLCLKTPCNAQKEKLPPEWFKALPECPCRNPDLNGVKLNDGWARDKGNLEKYHQGATTSFRSYPVVKTSAGKSGQQCCYDANGDLITSGKAAGTPDKAGTCKGEDAEGKMKVRTFSLLKHYFQDVKPWNRFMKVNAEGWKTYNAFWIPSPGDDCKSNPL